MAFGGVEPFRERTVVVPEGWTMAQKTAPEKWMPAVVPGTVLQTLVKNGVVPDPYWGLNNKIEEKRIPDLSENRDFYTVTYRAKVTLPEAWFRDRTVWMRPEGINYRGGIRLNGRFVAGTAGTFARTAIDVTEFLRPGVNDVEVEVLPVDQPGAPQQKAWGAPGEWHNGGDGEIGRNVTVLMGAGWDFMFNDGIRDRHAGIWKDLTFFSTDLVRLDAPFVRTKLNGDMTEAELTLECDLVNAGYNWGQRVSGVLEAEVEGTDVKFAKRMEFFRGERRTEKLTATLRNPKLWWPRNKGPQNLYTLKARFVVDARKVYDANTKKSREIPARVSDSVTTRFGVREFKSDQSGKDGARQFYVNRRKIFIRGTNWIPEGMLRQDDDRMAKEVRLTAESGVNMVRLWAGGITESDYFYQLCDEYGLLVWQEFWMTGDTRHPDDPGLYLNCVREQVKRIRAHASICHWTASNESTIVDGTEELVRALTGTESWMQNSECDGVHDGSPYFPVNPMCHYFDEGSPRGKRIYGFSPEYGTCALPSVEALREFMPEELLWPVEKNAAAWKYREGGGFDRMTQEHHAFVKAYGRADSIDEYARRSEAADALGHQTLWEVWNMARNTATGILFWYNNTPVPQIGSHAWDYGLEQGAAFFAQKRALEPLHAQYDYRTRRVVLTSDLVDEKRLAVRAEVWNLDSKKIWEQSVETALPAETALELFELPEAKGVEFVRLFVEENGVRVGSQLYWRSTDAYGGRTSTKGPCTSGFEALADLPKATLDVGCADRDGVKRIRVANRGDKLAFMTRIKFLTKDGKRVKGTFFDDNYFTLFPGEAKTVTVEGVSADAVMDVSAWNAERAQPGFRTLALDVFRDKMQGAWVGQMAGVAWGQPTEFRFNGRIIPADKVPTWTNDFHDRFSYGNDDLYVEMTFLKSLEDYGLDVSARQAGIDFANSEYGLWCANLQGRTNLRKGIAPPDSAHPHFSSRGNDIDYQIEADYSGIVAPGLPQEAIRLGNVFGRLVNWGDGLWAGEFVGALYAEAYFTRDVNRLLDAGLKAIPCESDYAKMVSNVRAWHRESPGDWSNAWAKVNATYGSAKKLRGSNGGIDARLNGACIVLGLLYGNGDIEKSMEIAMRCGWDSDCNPSNVGGILGCAYGLKALPEKYTSTVNLHKKFSFTAYDLEGVYRISEKLARDIIVRHGGKVEDGAFVIPVQTPVPDAYLPTWAAGPVTGAKYTAEETAKMRFAVKLPNASELADPDPTRRVQKTLDALFPGWKALPCGKDRNPGYEEAVHLPRGQLDYGYVRTHPTKYCGTEPTGFVRDVVRVPEGDPRLNVTVCPVVRRPIRLVLKVNGETVQEETVAWKPKVETGLRKLSFSLARFAGKPAKLELLHLPGGTTDESVLWGHLSLTANNGSF